MIRGTRTRIGIALVAALATIGIAAGCGGGGSSSTLASVSDITSDTTIGVQEGTTGQDYAEKKTDATVQKYPEIGGA